MTISPYIRSAIAFGIIALTGCVHAQTKEGLGGTGGASGLSGFQSNVQPQLQLNTSGCPAGTCAGGILNQTYSLSFQIVNGIQPYGCSLNSGTLPNGTSVTVSGSTCVVSGTLTPNAGNFTFVLKVTDSASTPNQALSGNLTVAVGCPAFNIVSPGLLPPGLVSSPYGFTVQTSGGITPISFLANPSGIPTGETLSSGGVFAGTPSTAGNYPFVITAQDSCNLGPQVVTQNASEQVNAVLAVTTPPTLPATQVGTAENTTLSAIGGTPPYTWTQLTVDGLTLNQNGFLQGNTSLPGAFSFTGIVTDSLGASASQKFTLQVNCAQLLITNTNPLCQGTQGQQYSCQMTASGGFGQLNWSSAGLAACGLGIDKLAGLISGTDTCVGTFSPTISVVDQCPAPQNSQTAQGTFDITTVANNGALAFATGNPLNSPTTGFQFTQQMAASGGLPPYFFTLSSGGFPTGISMPGTAGVISGTATQALTTVANITLTDSTTPTPQSVGPVAFTMTSACSVLGLSPSSNQTGTQGSTFKLQMNGSGGYLTLSYSDGGTLSGTGLSINPTTGLISGTLSTAGSFPIAITATDQCSPTPQTFTVNFTLTVASNLAIVTPSLPNGTVSSPYSATVTAAGGTPGYSFAITTGSIPGLTMNSGGVLSGTPTTAGTYQITVTVTDSLSHTASQNYTVIISPNTPPPTTVQLPTSWVNTHECDATLTAPNQTISFPSSWTGGGPYTNNAAGLQSAVNDAETYRKNHLASGAVLINIAPGSLFTSSGHTLTLPQTTGDTSTQCIALATTGTLTAGQTVCTHGTQDSNAEATQPATRNPSCTSPNDVAQMWTVETSGAAGGASAINTGPADANGTGPHHYLINGVEMREAASDTSKVQVLFGVGSLNLNETLLSQLPSHIYLDRSWLHNYCLDNQTGCTSGILHVALFDANIGGITNSQFSQNIYGGQQSQDIFTVQSQTVKIVNNWLDGSAQQTICGGNPVTITNGMQSCNDLEYRRNRLTYPASWLGSTFKPNAQSPNRIAPFECKSCNRVLLDGNILENEDDSGAQWKLLALNPKAYNNVLPQYYINVSNITVTNDILRSGCQQGALWGTRSAAAPNGNGVSQAETLFNFSNNLMYNISRPSFCSTQDSAGGLGLELDQSDVQFTCTAQRNAAGTQTTLTCTDSGTGMAQTDTNVGDPVVVTNCSDATFNVGAGSIIGPPALAGTNPNGLTVVYANPGTANATATNCHFDNFQGTPTFLTLAHNTIIGTGQGLYMALARGLAGGTAFVKNATVRDNIFTSGGINGQGLSDAAPPNAQTRDWDLPSNIFRNNVYTGRNCSNYTDVLTSGGALTRPPITSQCPATNTCSGATANSTCVGFLGLMSTTTFNVNLADWNNYGLAPSSLFKSGAVNAASDGTDKGASMPAIGTAETRTQYPASGSFPD